MSARIVVVDDSSTIRHAIAFALERKGFQVFQGSNGLEAIELVYREDPDLLVSDVMMPELNGYQVCRLLKNDPAMGDLPIVLLTTLDHQEHRFWGREAGADSYVIKAMDPAPLEEEVARLLREKKRLPAGRRPEKNPSPLGQAGVKTRLGNLLDRLLFEATIVSRVRQLARLGTLPDLLEGFFEFLKQLIDYRIALFSLESEEGPRLFAYLHETVPANWLGEAQRIAGEKEGWIPKNSTAKITILNKDSLGPEQALPEGPSPSLWSSFSSLPGGLAIFSWSSTGYNEETAHNLKIAIQELETILQSVLRAEALERLKSDFSAMIAHDLRSPLTAIVSSATMMADGLLGAVNEEQQQWLAKIETGARKMVLLINDFLDLSKIEAGRLDLAREDCDLERLIQECADHYLPLAKEKKITLRTRAESLPPLQADSRRLDQVLVNLLSNALKFTPAGGTIEIGAVQNAAEFRVWVKDSGVGISVEETSQIFEKYRQTASGKTAKEKGTGLGLVICKMIVESHGGRIWVESEEGKGATFLFTLPISSQTAP